jgi:hypothetical protein
VAGAPGLTTGAGPHRAVALRPRGAGADDDRVGDGPQGVEGRLVGRRLQRPAAAVEGDPAIRRDDEPCPQAGGLTRVVEVQQVVDREVPRRGQQQPH